MHLVLILNVDHPVVDQVHYILIPTVTKSNGINSFKHQGYDKQTSFPITIFATEFIPAGLQREKIIIILWFVYMYTHKRKRDRG